MVAHTAAWVYLSLIHIYPEMAVRLAWIGMPALNLDASCRYIDRQRGGISHFHYVRDNLAMIRMHVRLLGARIFGRRNAAL